MSYCMNSSFEYITSLEYRLKAARTEIQAFKSGEKYVRMQKEYQKEWSTNNPVYQKEYAHKDLNSDGKTKHSIRLYSRRILFKQRKHTKLKDYHIHHCFGYDDPSKFVYIPKSLHCKIHRYLRANNIDADSNHYDFIKYMINECEEYTYISV